MGGKARAESNSLTHSFILSFMFLLESCISCKILFIRRNQETSYKLGQVILLQI